MNHQPRRRPTVLRPETNRSVSVKPGWAIAWGDPFSGLSLSVDADGLPFTTPEAAQRAAQAAGLRLLVDFRVVALLPLSRPGSSS